MATIRDEAPRGRNAEANILCVSRLMVGKGLLELVRAPPLVRREHSCRLVVAGDGLRRRASERWRRISKFRTMSISPDLSTERNSRAFTELPTCCASNLYEGRIPGSDLRGHVSRVADRDDTLRGPADYLVENAVFVPPRDSRCMCIIPHPTDSVPEEYLAVLERIVGASRTADRPR
jgi:hypothetical protein